MEQMINENVTLEKIKVVILDFDDTMYTANNQIEWPVYTYGFLEYYFGVDGAKEFIIKNKLDTRVGTQIIASVFRDLYKTTKPLVKYINKHIYMWNTANVRTLTNDHLKMVKEKGYKFYVVSNSSKPYLKYYFKKFGLDIRLVDKVYSNGYNVKDITKAVNYKKIIKRNKVNPDEVIMIGDNYASDIIPAQSLGMQFKHIQDVNETIEFINNLPKRK